MGKDLGCQSQCKGSLQGAASMSQAVGGMAMSLQRQAPLYQAARVLDDTSRSQARQACDGGLEMESGHGKSREATKGGRRCETASSIDQRCAPCMDDETDCIASLQSGIVQTPSARASSLALVFDGQLAVMHTAHEGHLWIACPARHAGAAGHVKKVDHADMGKWVRDLEVSGGEATSKMDAANGGRLLHRP